MQAHATYIAVAASSNFDLMHDRRWTSSSYTWQTPTPIILPAKAVFTIWDWTVSVARRMSAKFYIGLLAIQWRRLFVSYLPMIFHAFCQTCTNYSSAW